MAELDLSMVSVWWFWTPASRKYHAWVLTRTGDWRERSICGRLELDKAEDEPSRSVEERMGWCCGKCLGGLQ